MDKGILGKSIPGLLATALQSWVGRYRWPCKATPAPPITSKKTPFLFFLLLNLAGLHSSVNMTPCYLLVTWFWKLDSIEF